MTRCLCTIFIILCTHLAIAQSYNAFNISGTINTIHGERLPSAQISISPQQILLTTDSTGAFSVRTSSGYTELKVSFLGYETSFITFNLRRDTLIRVVLQESFHQLQIVEVEDQRDKQVELFESNQTSTNILDKDDITAIPVLGGEADVIKTLQLLPGTVRGIEGSSDLFVRGGAADQNLVLLDGAPVYNTSHLFGFLSVFNPDVLDKVESINGGFPARYGGRLSSIMNVNTTSDIPDKTHVSGEIGLIASRFMIEQPVLKNKASFWVAARRTYIDKVVALAGEELPYFFYDLNGKVIYKPDEQNVFEFSYYGGEDVLDWFRDRNNDGDGFLTTYESGNNSQSLIWKRKMTSGWRSDLSLVRSAYQYDIRNSFEDNRLVALSDIEDYTTRMLFHRDSIHGNSSFTTGGEWTRHTISPNVINTTGLISQLLESSSTRGRIADEFALHAEYTFSPMPSLTIAGGLRGSAGVLKNKVYVNPEPRISVRYGIDQNQALKLSYTRMAQYIHRISNSAVSTPTDIWYPVTDSIRPQTSHQFALAWQKVMQDKKMFLSVEGYYKSMSSLIGYEEGTNLFFNTDFESKLIQGRGRAYGVETLLRKDAGKLTGWLSYTLAWSWRKFDEIDQGRWFPSRYDRRHNGAVVMQYAFNKRWSASVVWEFISGSRFTPVVGQYVVVAPTLTGADLIPLYSRVNGVKLADTHRLDVGIKLRSKPGKKFQWHWFAGIYNVYNRAAPVGIAISQDENTGTLRYQQPGLFGLLPFISYGFSL